MSSPNFREVSFCMKKGLINRYLITIIIGTMFIAYFPTLIVAVETGDTPHLAKESNIFPEEKTIENVLSDFPERSPLYIYHLDVSRMVFADMYIQIEGCSLYELLTVYLLYYITPM